MKKNFCIISLIIVVLTVFSTVLANQTIEVKVVDGYVTDGVQEFNFNSQSGIELPIIEYMDSIYVPIRSFCRYIGKDVEWSCNDITEILIKSYPKNKYEGRVYGEEQYLSECPIVSMIELIAYPEKYDGKKVSVRGIINVGYESDRLFLTREDYEYYIIENSITWSQMNLDFPIEANDTREFYELFGEISGIYVEMEGTFRANEIASNGFSARGYLDDIKCIICNESYND